MFSELVGYLLAALEGDERERTAARLQADGDARRMLESIARLLAPLECLRCHEDAPDGLARRTCVFIRGVHATIEVAPAAEGPSETPRPDAP